MVSLLQKAGFSSNASFRVAAGLRALIFSLVVIAAIVATAATKGDLPAATLDLMTSAAFVDTGQP